MDISLLLDLISDDQLGIYVEWLESNPEATEEDSSDFLMDLLTDRQLDEYMETFESTLYSAEGGYDCMVCGSVSESDMTQDDQICDPCLKTHGQCGVCQDIELLTDLHLDSTGMMELCARCEKHDTFGADNRNSGISKVKVFVEREDNTPWKYITFEMPTHIVNNEDLLHDAIEDRLVDILQQPFGGWDVISVDNAETFESTPYGNYYGACVAPDGRCFETTMETCRDIEGRFQGPGTSCGGYQPPLMAAEQSKTPGKGIWLAVTVGVMTGVASAVFGNIISEMWLDRLREDPELHTTPEEE